MVMLSSDVMKNNKSRTKRVDLCRVFYIHIDPGQCRAVTLGLCKCDYVDSRPCVSGEDILFNVAPAYSDMTYQMAGLDRPNPRVVSNNIFKGRSGQPSDRNHTALFAFFGKTRPRQ